MARSDWHRPEKFDAPPGKRRVALTIRYDGRSFCGWQTQDGQPSVQGAVKQAAMQFTGLADVLVCGSGRTDSGVHAMGQVAHIEFDSSCSLPPKAFLHGLNALLPYTVRIVDCIDVPPSFHARYSAMAREYRYFWAEFPLHDPFLEGRAGRVRELADTALLDSYAKCIEGTHDFTTFAGAQDQSPSRMRDIYESVITLEKSMYGIPVICYRICGNAFLYHMVRSICGTMYEMALEKRSVQEFRHVLEAGDRSLCRRTAEAGGLYLWRISYNPDEYLWFEK